MKGSADLNREVLVDAPEAKKLQSSPDPSLLQLSSAKPKESSQLSSQKKKPASLSKEWAIKNPIASPHLYCTCESPCGSHVNKINPFISLVCVCLVVYILLYLLTRCTYPLLWHTYISRLLDGT
uniref:Uncharacterized protein n=1 Tax=Ditylenchus dipsaci TaxID=166011 RepID=A0A915DM85_9BILA